MPKDRMGREPGTPGYGTHGNAGMRSRGAGSRDRDRSARMKGLQMVMAETRRQRLGAVSPTPVVEPPPPHDGHAKYEEDDEEDG